MRPKTPQEKKDLSYERDRRNVYGNSPHAARNTIPLHKKRRNRANRHMQDQPLRAAAGTDDESLDEIESRVFERAPRVWSKLPDAPLRDVIQRRRKARVRREGQAKSKSVRPGGQRVYGKLKT